MSMKVKVTTTRIVDVVVPERDVDWRFHSEADGSVFVEVKHDLDRSRWLHPTAVAVYRKAFRELFPEDYR